VGSSVSRRPSRFRVGRVLRSVRFKIILLLLVPLVSLSTLWAFAASITLGDGLNLLHVKTIQDRLAYPSGALGSALETERRLSLVFLGSKLPGDRASMESARLITDRQVDLFRRLATDKSAQDAATPEARLWTHEILRNLDALPARRRSIDGATARRQLVFDGYSATIKNINALQSSLSTLSAPEVGQDTKTQVALGQAREVLSQEDALLSGAIAAGRVSFAEHVQFTKLVGTQRTLYSAVLPDLRPADRAYYQRIVATPEYARLQALEDRFTNHMPQPGSDAMVPAAGTDVQWKTTVSSVITRFRGLELSSTASAAQRAKPIATGIILRVGLAGALGLLAVIASLVLSLWVGRSVIRELNGLRRAALELARERLPTVIRRLRRGEDVDVAAEAPPLSFSTEEIDQVGQAFNVARRTAIQGAVEEATLRRSISEVFLNLARRNQALLHRQLSLLDAMERRIAEPDELEDLFRLDHLATRMRRHAEGLIILSGQAPGRGWRNPVPVVDVARAAAAEVEDYARVTVTTMPRVSVAGSAVADLIHLLAELIENATMFSPPDTTVQVSAQTVAHGFALEVEDRGLSMDPASLARANEKLANPPEFDLSNSAQLGLFVVSRLAQRHAIQVTLRTSPYGGTTAIVLLPEDIVVRGDQPQIGSSRLAVTRRGEDAMVPIGAIGAPAPYGNGTGDTGPMPLVPGERPPLPRRHDAVSPPTGYDATVNDDRTADPDTGPFASYRSDVGSYDASTSYGSDTSSYDPATDTFTSGDDTYEPGGYGSGPARAGSYGAGRETDAYDPSSFGSSTLDAESYTSDSFGSSTLDAESYTSDSFGTGTTYDSGPSTGGWSSVPAGEETGPIPQLPREPTGTSWGDAETTRRPSVFDPLEDTGPAPATPSYTPTSGSRPALPRRVRQANLAPQLRDEAEPVTDAASSERSPEELRTMLSSIQKGWLRGRSEADQTTAHEQEEDI
jgi:signal transduction histidine kinase